MKTVFWYFFMPPALTMYSIECEMYTQMLRAGWLYYGNAMVGRVVRKGGRYGSWREGAPYCALKHTSLCYTSLCA